MENTKPDSVDAALDFIAGYVERPRETVRRAPLSAVNHVLARNLFAPANLPRFDSAAMDGFAVRSLDLVGKGETSLKIAGSIAAGQQSDICLDAGEAAIVMTGAPVPPGADRVIVQENGEVVGDRVDLHVPPAGKVHIRYAGEDVALGALMMRAGTRLTTGHAALLTALDIGNIDVFPKPRVALVSTGDELVDSGGSLGPGKIYDTNRPMLMAMLRDTGVDVTDLGIIADTPDKIVSTLAEAAADHDLIVSSGGASAGFADHLAEAVSQRGYLEFWKLNMKPGKPIGFGDVNHCPVLLLPGNPVAAAVGFALFGRLLISAFEGIADHRRTRLMLPIEGQIANSPVYTQVLLARYTVDRHSGQTRVKPLPDQGSASLTALAAAEALILLKPGQGTTQDGSVVEVEPLWRR